MRKVFDVENADLGEYYDELGSTLGECLLTPTRIYVKSILALLDAVQVKSISHITGGGFYENIPRCLPDGKQAVIDRASVDVLPIFQLIAKKGGISERDMFNTFNMGVGMCVVVKKEDAAKAVEVLIACGEKAKVIGRVEDGDQGVVIC